jgi:2-iminobutanoate/2-iminopropanoate deaminase
LSAESRRYINLPNRLASLPFSDAVLVGDTLYISGRIGLDPATGEAPESIDAELEFLLDGFQAVLRQAGMTMDDLVWVQVYSPDVSLWQQFNAAYVKLFSREFPARAFLGSGRLLLKGRFEMLGIAVKVSAVNIQKTICKRNARVGIRTRSRRQHPRRRGRKLHLFRREPAPRVQMLGTEMGPRAFAPCPHEVIVQGASDG